MSLDGRGGGERAFTIDALTPARRAFNAIPTILRTGYVARSDEGGKQQFGNLWARIVARRHDRRAHWLHCMGSNHRAHAAGDAINAVLAAVGDNFRFLLKWLRLMLLKILIALSIAAKFRFA